MGNENVKQEKKKMTRSNSLSNLKRKTSVKMRNRSKDDMDLKTENRIEGRIYVNVPENKEDMKTKIIDQEIEIRAQREIINLSKIQIDLLLRSQERDKLIETNNYGRLQASDQSYQVERSTRLNLEDQLRRPRESTENELVQERRRRREELELFAQERRTYEQRLQESERRIQELQTTVNNSQSIHRRIEPRDWIIRREEVTFTDVSLGNGAWGTVNVGVFRSCNVAVKQIHKLILSPHNRRLFEREMSIAARCRHPCLLQFIGATNDDGVPLFITELLDVNLRAVLSRRSLHQEEIIMIALDVARALNYLHLSRPFPIIHRDISSSNVLLWKRDTCWRAKLSDYGAANFMRQSMTANPGACIYAAPEASTSQQSPKLDIYSFGLLLCELCIRQLPVPKQTQEQITLVTNGMLRELIIRCVRVDPETRPTMADIITLLEQQQVHLLELE